ncbi:hypothetical protein ABIE78_000808 [Sinorhizobium fredii]
MKNFRPAPIHNLKALSLLEAQRSLPPDFSYWSVNGQMPEYSAAHHRLSSRQRPRFAGLVRRSGRRKMSALADSRPEAETEWTHSTRLPNGRRSGSPVASGMAHSWKPPTAPSQADCRDAGALPAHPSAGSCRPHRPFLGRPAGGLQLSHRLCGRGSRDLRRVRAHESAGDALRYDDAPPRRRGCLRPVQQDIRLDRSGGVCRGSDPSSLSRGIWGWLRIPLCIRPPPDGSDSLIATIRKIALTKGGTRSIAPGDGLFRIW